MRNTEYGTMTATELRREIKKIVDQLPPERLASLADYVHFLGRPPLPRRIKAAEKAVAAGRGVNWRKIRSDV
jgi:alkylated DNA nucleotide flippase Atl1